MPQLFHVLRCYICSVFQAHQTKKTNKWECRICGEKQSVKRFYGIGTAKECRFQVHKLNAIRGEINELKKNIAEDSFNKNEQTVTEPIKHNYAPVKNSKWSSYLDGTETVEENANKNMSLGGAEVVLDVPKKHRKLNDNKQLVSSVTVPSTSNSAGGMHANTPQPRFYSEDLIAKEQAMNKKHSSTNTFIAPVTNDNSKWAQFAEEPDETEETDNLSPSHSFDETHDLFSWCDETDLDLILDI